MTIAHQLHDGALVAALLAGVSMPALATPPQVEHESLSLKERVAVRKGIDNVRNQRSLIFVFSPGPDGPFCDQATVLSRSAQQLLEYNMGVVWLFSHDAIGMSSSTVMCAAPTTRNDVSVRQMKIKGAGFNDGGSSMLYRYFKIDAGAFAVLVLDTKGRVKLRSVTPVKFDALLKAVLPSRSG